MRSFAVLAMVAAAAAASAQTKLKVVIQGRPAGFAYLTQRSLPSGGKSVELRVELTIGTRAVTVRQETTYDAKGAPVRALQDTTAASVHGKRQVIADFNPAGAHVIVEENAIRRPRDVSLVPTAPRADASQLWFLRSRPKAGETVKTYRFNLDTLEWELAEVAYAGREVVTAGGKKWHANKTVTKVDDRTTTSYLDDEGVPILIKDSSGVRMER